MQNKEIEQAREDLNFFNEGEYITKEMAHSARVLEQYIEDLENEKEEAYWKRMDRKSKLGYRNM